MPDTIEPRGYQREAIDSIVSAFSDERKPRAYVEMACGTGKSLVALWALQELHRRGHDIRSAVVFARRAGGPAQRSRSPHRKTRALIKQFASLPTPCPRNRNDDFIR